MPFYYSKTDITNESFNKILIKTSDFSAYFCVSPIVPTKVPKSTKRVR